ncbi:MAG: hypothetical protein K8H89_09680 [Flavobacteriales bacterium]|nr:hypothetical protein [Flavobacteriales bacterium]
MTQPNTGTPVTTPEALAAKKAEKKKKKSAKKLKKLNTLLDAAGAGKQLGISDVNHLELVKAVSEVEDGLKRIRKLLTQDRTTA